MENDSAFRPGGSTLAVVAATSAPTPVQIGGPAAGDVSVLVWNSSATITAFVAFGPNAAAATAGAVIPTTGNPQACLPMPPNAIQTFTLTGQQVANGNVVTTGLYVTAICASTTATLYITPGTGI